jgi:hypothetical protein
MQQLKSALAGMASRSGDDAEEGDNHTIGKQSLRTRDKALRLECYTETESSSLPRSRERMRGNMFSGSEPRACAAPTQELSQSQVKDRRWVGAYPRFSDCWVNFELSKRGAELR